MQFKLVIYTSTKVIYMIISEDELDSIYNRYSNSDGVKKFYTKNVT